jgi:eukaryotic-like serine/threonine-protein kinase
MNFSELIKNKTLWKQIGLLIGVTVILVFVASWILSIYTRHGEAIAMPNMVGKSLESVQSDLSTSDFELIVRDSIFDNKTPKHNIVSQDPPAGTKVKKHRKVYVTIVAMGTKKAPFPSLNDLSLRQATQLLENNGFSVGQVIYQPSEFDNIVIEQRYKGKKMEEGQMLEQGSAITLIVGKSSSSENESEKPESQE